MTKPPIPAKESERLAALSQLGPLDSSGDEAFDQLTRLAAQLLNAPMCLITLLDEETQWLLSRVGVDATHTSRDVAFCTYAIADSARVMVVPDAHKDTRFSGNPFVTGEPNIRFYAGAPLVTDGGHALGTLCVLDSNPRQPSAEDLQVLQILAEQVVSQLEMRRIIRAQDDAAKKLRISEERLSRAQRVAGVGSWEFSMEDQCVFWSPKTFEIFGLNPTEEVPSFDEIMARHHPEDEIKLRAAVQEAIETSRPYELDLRIKRSHGYIFVQANCEVIVNESGDPIMLLGTVRDITERHCASQRVVRQAETTAALLEEVREASLRSDEMARTLEHAAHRFENLFSGLPVACMTVAIDGMIIDWNEKCRDVFGYQGFEVSSQCCFDVLVRPEIRPAFVQRFESNVATGGHGSFELEAVNRNGVLMLLSISTLPVHDLNGQLTGLICTLIDVTAEREAQEKLRNNNRLINQQRRDLASANRALQRLADTDALTGLKNRRALQNNLSTLFSRSKRSGHPFSVIMLDVDHFKSFNDSFGHAGGDEVLKTVAEILKSTARAADFVARFGGEEFVIVLPDSDRDQATVAAERIRAAIESAEWEHRGVTVSIGVACFSLLTPSPDELIRLADDALYASKNDGRNRVTVAA